ALIDQKLVIVDGEDFADTAAGRELVGVFVSGPGRDVDSHDADVVVAILEQWRLHDAHQGLAVRRDRQTFHALVGDTAGGVGRLAFRGGRGSLNRNGKIVGKRECPCALTGGAVELVYVGSVFIGDEYARTIFGNAHTLRVQTGIVRVGRRAGAEVVRTAGEVVGVVDRVQGRHSASQRGPTQSAGPVDERRRAR